MEASAFSPFAPLPRRINEVHVRLPEKFREGNPLFFVNMSDISANSENDNLSGEVGITGSSESMSFVSDRTTTFAEQTAWTSDNLLDVSDIPTPSRLTAMTSHAREGTHRLRQILQMEPTTRPDRAFLENLNDVSAPGQPSQVVDLTTDKVAASDRTSGQVSSSGLEEIFAEGSESSGSTTPPGEPV